MRDYIEVESAIRAIPGIITVTPYRTNNLITPWVTGFIPLVDGIEAEITYGTAFGGGYSVGFTLFKNQKLMPIEDREAYDKCFMDYEIKQIAAYAETVKEQLKKAEV